MIYQVSNLSQEEISVFIKEIIAGSQTLQVIATTGESFEIDQSKVNWAEQLAFLLNFYI